MWPLRTEPNLIFLMALTSKTDLIQRRRSLITSTIPQDAVFNASACALTELKLLLLIIYPPGTASSIFSNKEIIQPV